MNECNMSKCKIFKVNKCIRSTHLGSARGIRFFIIASIRSLFPCKSSLVSVGSFSFGTNYSAIVISDWIRISPPSFVTTRRCTKFLIAHYYFGSCNMHRQLPQHWWAIHIVCVRTTISIIVGWIAWIRTHATQTFATWRCHELQDVWTRDFLCRLFIQQSEMILPLPSCNN
jgi:hypothetical protein